MIAFWIAFLEHIQRPDPGIIVSKERERPVDNRAWLYKAFFMERLPNFYQVPGVTPHMEYYNANNISLPLLSRHPTEQMFRSHNERPAYDLNNTMEYVDCDSSRALQMIAPPEPAGSRSTLLLDIVQATRKRPSMNSASHCSGLATSSKSCDAFHESRSPEEVNSLSRQPGHGFPGDCLSSSRPSPVGIPRPFRDGEVPVAGLTASKVVDGHGIPHSADKDLESAMAGLDMDNILRGYFHPKPSPRSYSTHNPTSMERRELQAPPIVDSTPSPSSQAECNATSGPPQSGLSDRLAPRAASFNLSRPNFRQTPEGMGTVDFNAITKGKQQIPSAGGKGLSEGSSSLGPAPLCEGFKSTFTRTSTTTIDASDESRLKRRRIRGDSTGETQRMTHIAVERNRRKQMNDHLCTLRDLMPSSFVQKTDQASIIGAAVEYVKELETTLESLQSILRTRMAIPPILSPSWNGLNIPSGPALSAAASYAAVNCQTPSLLSATKTSEDAVYRLRSRRLTMSPKLFPIPEDSRVTNEVDKVESRSAPVAKVEVRFLGEDAIVNIALQRKEKQIVEVIVAVESLFLTILHSTINTVNDTVRYAFFAKVGPKCRMSANEIAATLHQIFNCQLF